MSSSRGQSPWIAPQPKKQEPVLRLYNSLTRRKDEFIPATDVVTWYSCGPTVYDHAHMGHARSYISFDILRRVLQDYFQYPILFVQNVTDIDDKIIKRARINYLYESYKKANLSSAEVARDLMAALQVTRDKIALAEPDKKKMLMEQVAKVSVYAAALSELQQEGSSVEQLQIAVSQLLDVAEPVLGEWLDKERGSSVTDNSIFIELPRRFEKEYNDDMARLNILGSNVDIHSGGVDLKFPHHDNELAQSEAYYQCSQWITYFLHTGHLHIDGCKMSKSLKNFISIGDALKEHSAAELRMAFLLHQWKETLDYSSNTMEGAKQYLKMVTEFGLNTVDLQRRHPTSSNIWTDIERQLDEVFNKARSGVHEALCDNVDTRTALDHMRYVISEANKYMNSGSKVNAYLVGRINAFIQRILIIFGVDVAGSNCQDGSPGAQLMPLCQVVAQVREELRVLARQAGTDADIKALQAKQLQLCDRIRDELLPPLGVRLEDREDGMPSIKLQDPQKLQKEILDKKAAEEAKLLEKQKKREAAEAKKALEQSKHMQPPEEMFKTSEYSAWDACTGIPTHDAQGEEITKSQLKKLSKLQEAYRKKYDKWRSQQQSQ